MEAWQAAQSAWISTGKAIESISKYGTEVWLYFNQADELVGFGSLGKTRRPVPPPNGPYLHISIIPSLAIRRELWGKPTDPPKYSQQILDDLIYEARAHGTELLILEVDPQNIRAIKLYQSRNFIAYGVSRNGNTVMMHRLQGAAAS